MDRKSVYVLGMPAGRDAGRRPERWAAREIENLADEAQLDLRLGASVERRQRRQEPHWFVCQPRSTLAHRWARWLFNAERRVGVHDTGTVFHGSFDEARRRAVTGSVRAPFPASSGGTRRHAPDGCGGESHVDGEGDGAELYGGCARHPRCFGPVVGDAARAGGLGAAELVVRDRRDSASPSCVGNHGRRSDPG